MPQLKCRKNIYLTHSLWPPTKHIKTDFHQKVKGRSSCVSNSTPPDLCRCWRKSCKRGLLSKWTGSLEVFGFFFRPNMLLSCVSAAVSPPLNPKIQTPNCRHSDRASGSSSPKVPVFLSDTAPHLKIFIKTQLCTPWRIWEEKLLTVSCCSFN